jgi:hypothetical protein
MDGSFLKKPALVMEVKRGQDNFSSYCFVLMPASDNLFL